MQLMIFYELSNNINPKIDIVRKSIRLNKKLRILIDRDVNEIDNSQLLQEVIAEIPKELAWLGYENCAVVTKLYAIYESFVEKIITTWIKELPKLVPKYSDLDDRIKEHYIDNVGRIFRDIKKQRFSDLKLDEIISKLYYCVTNHQRYELLPDAFTIHDRHLRKEDLEELFKNAGIISNAWEWVKNNRNIQNFITNNSEETTAEGLLKELIDYRNNAAHADIVIDDILGSDKLLQLCDFIESICVSLSELITYQCLQKQEKQDKVIKIGCISEWVKNPKAGVLKISNAKVKIKLGDRLFLTSKFDCQIASIVSLKIDDVFQQEINALSATEIGIKFDIDARKNLEIYQVIVH
jgi:MAE_28990/MAE_18760-like HEPN